MAMGTAQASYELNVKIMLEICLLQGVFETHFRLQIITKIMSFVLLRNRSYVDIFFKKNQFLGCSREFLKFFSGIYFLLINTSLIEKESHPHRVTLDEFFHHRTRVTLTIVLKKNMKNH